MSRSSRPRASRTSPNAPPAHKYEALIDWSHYAPEPREERSSFTSVSVAEMYWLVVHPIRARELELQRNKAVLLKEHGPFPHLRKAGASPAKPAAPAAAAKPAKEGKAGGGGRTVEKVVYTDASGESYEVTCDRKRKLADISSALGSLGLCPLLAQICEKDGTPITPHDVARCACKGKANGDAKASAGVDGPSPSSAKAGRGDRRKSGASEADSPADRAGKDDGAEAAAPAAADATPSCRVHQLWLLLSRPPPQKEVSEKKDGDKGKEGASEKPAEKSSGGSSSSSSSNKLRDDSSAATELGHALLSSPLSDLECKLLRQVLSSAISEAEPPRSPQPSRPPAATDSMRGVTACSARAAIVFPGEDPTTGTTSPTPAVTTTDPLRLRLWGWCLCGGEGWCGG